MKRIITFLFLPTLALAGPIGDWYAARTDKDLLRSVTAINAPGAVTNVIPATTNQSPRAVWEAWIGQGWTQIVTEAGLTASDRTNPPSVVLKLKGWITNTANLGTRAQRQLYAGEFMREIPRRIDGSTPNPADTEPVVTAPIEQRALSFAMTNIGRAVSGVADLEQLLEDGQ